MARYTLIQSGDFNAAENIGALAGDIQREGIVSGLGLSAFDASIPEIDVAAGKTVHVIDSQIAEATLDDGTTVSEQRDQVQLISHVDPQTVGLTDNAINELYLTPQPAVDDSPNVVATTTGEPSVDALKIGEVDTATDTVSERWNRITSSGSISFPDETSAEASAASLTDGSEVYVRDRERTFIVKSGELRSRGAGLSDGLIAINETVTVRTNERETVGGTVTVNGTLTVDGQTVLHGPISGDGVITGDGTVGLTDTISDSVEPIDPDISAGIYQMLSGWTTENTTSDSDSFDAYQFPINSALEVEQNESLTFEKQ
ncbi:hypothetical protein OSG_eHP16_00035 [environmental Halophage eHP-16]|nr:hypothetical protein OSG_eHP16_00035 [environmental Halophage eHP-16]